MDRMKVESSNIAEIGYDMETLTLEIKFHKGGVYQYWPFTIKAWDMFRTSTSKNSFFLKWIKFNKSINFRKLDEMQADNKSN